MYAEITSKPIVPGASATFALHDLTDQEMELLQCGLVHLKHNKLIDAEVFKPERALCDKMFNRIDTELRKSRS